MKKKKGFKATFSGQFRNLIQVRSSLGARRPKPRSEGRPKRRGWEDLDGEKLMLGYRGPLEYVATIVIKKQNGGGDEGERGA